MPIYISFNEVVLESIRVQVLMSCTFNFSGSELHTLQQPPNL